MTSPDPWPDALASFRSRLQSAAQGGASVGLVVVAAFTLGCQDLFDADVWWHVRAGQWIWQQGQPPALDPFTFGSADRPWVDLHWLFQIILAAAHRTAGVRGLILMTALACALAVWIGLSARPQRSPFWLAPACWLPALVVMSARFDPRPEVFSLLGMAAYLAVLHRADQNPAMLWILPLVQVVWVNTHALFVLGPIMMGAYLIDRMAGSVAWATAARAARHEGAQARGGAGAARQWAAHVTGATVMVGLSCLLNPYTVRGALFPLELFPKITGWGGPYKSYVSEFMDMRAYVQKLGVEAAGSNLYLRAECFLLGALPLCFLMPALWRCVPVGAWSEESVRSGSPVGRAFPVTAVTWLGVFGGATGVILAWVLGFPAPGASNWLIELGRLAPAGVAALGLFGAGFLLLGRSCRAPRAALLAGAGGLAVAAWLVWLRGYLFDGEGPSTFGLTPGPGARMPGSALLGGGTLALGTFAAVLTLSAGGRLFRLLLVAMFGCLAFQAIRNINLFGLAAGFVLTWNLGEWCAELVGDAAAPWPRPWPALRLAARAGLAGALGLFVIAIVSDRFFRATGEARRFGLRETPLAYAHDAARFAGQPGLPERALVFDLRQAGVYLYHNGPQRKLFMDGRLEIPTRATFETYVRLDHMLNEGRPGWAALLRRMDEPLVLLDHEENFGAEATLLADPNWRCIYYDAVASIFVSTHLPGLEMAFPRVDFAARHFHDPEWRAVPPVPLGLAEAKALLNLGSAVRTRPAARSHWTLRFSLLLLACDRFRQAIQEKRAGPGAAAQWAALGNSCWNMLPDLTVPPLGLDGPWDPARGMLEAQATFCYRRALEHNPDEVGALVSLFDSFDARRMRDAQRGIVERMRHARASGGLGSSAGDAATSKGAGDDSKRARSSESTSAAGEPSPGQDGRDGLVHAVAARLGQGRPEAAVRAYLEARSRGVEPSWAACDPVGIAFLQLGQPQEARRVWERASDPPSEALRRSRMATADLAALDFPRAERTYRAALQLDAGLAEAWFGLALLHTQLGAAAQASSAARAGLDCSLTEAQRTFLEGIQTLAAPYARESRHDGTRSVPATSGGPVRE